MNATKFLISTAAAVTLASAIGFVYAQSSSSNSAGATGSTGAPGATGDTAATGGAQTQATPPGQTPANVMGTQRQQQNAAPASATSDSSRSGSTGNVNSGSTYNPATRDAPANVSPQTPTAATGQAPNNAQRMQSQRQDDMPGRMNADSMGTANTTGAAPMRGRTGRNMSDGTAPATDESNSNIRRNTDNTSGAMGTERNARPDRN